MLLTLSGAASFTASFTLLFLSLLPSLENVCLYGPAWALAQPVLPPPGRRRPGLGGRNYGGRDQPTWRPVRPAQPTSQAV